ncbi:MAG: 1-acyl-sn-glycerol-3-phosphate acyltransferase [Actinomycetota bacterium]|nr:1-acyl-sn-glycerol-3-phosphate acyltransferase [Actinomycetota bacterium]
MRWRVVTSGEEHLPLQGPAVIATNHVGYLDFAFVGAAARKRGRLVRFLAKQEVFEHRVSGPLMRGMKHIPVDRYGLAGNAIDLSIEALRRGEIVGMFPEGTISRSFVPAAGKTGAARMAIEAGAPLIPGAVWGSQRILTKGRPKNFERGVTITVDLAPPIPYEPGETPEAVTQVLMSEIERLVAGAAKTYPDQPRDETDSWWLPAHLGGSAPTVEESLEMARREREDRAARRRPE